MKTIKITGSKFPAIINNQNYKEISKWKWGISGKRGYAYRKETYAPYKQRQLYLHQAIMGTNKNLEIDHKNGNPLDNRRKNLKWVTHQQNMQNIKKKTPNKLNLQGVTMHTNKIGYQSRICVNGKRIFLGYFLNPQKAHKAYINAKIKYNK